MAEGTEKQLKERWLTPEGKKVKEQIVEHIKESKWERFLEGFPFAEEAENKKDLRFIDLNGTDLTGANLRVADLWKADLRGAYFIGANLTIAKMNKESS